jgi:hypothetical protein
MFCHLCKGKQAVTIYPCTFEQLSGLWLVSNQHKAKKYHFLKGFEVWSCPSSYLLMHIHPSLHNTYICVSLRSTRRLDVYPKILLDRRPRPRGLGLDCPSTPRASRLCTRSSRVTVRNPSDMSGLMPPPFRIAGNPGNKHSTTRRSSKQARHSLPHMTTPHWLPNTQ